MINTHGSLDYVEERKKESLTRIFWHYSM